VWTGPVNDRGQCTWRDERKWCEKANVPFHLAFTLRDLGERPNAARCDIVDPGARPRSGSGRTRPAQSGSGQADIYGGPLCYKCCGSAGSPTRWLACRALRKQCAGKTRFPRAQRRFGERKVDQVALGEAAAAAMDDVSHALEPFDALGIVAADEGKQRFAQRR
jgi:hypothetical protein